MITAIVGAILLFLVVAVVVAIARDRGPGPDDVAVAYELAWDRLDFEALFTVSGPPLRDGLDRRGFVSAKRAAYQQQHALTGLTERVGVAEMAVGHAAAVVVTTVELRDGSVVHNRLELVRRSGHWEVVAYRLVPAEGSAPADGAAATGG